MLCDSLVKQITVRCCVVVNPCLAHLIGWRHLHMGFDELTLVYIFIVVIVFYLVYLCCGGSHGLFLYWVCYLISFILFVIAFNSWASICKLSLSVPIILL